MRTARLKVSADGSARYYHCLSRVVDRRFIPGRWRWRRSNQGNSGASRAEIRGRDSEWRVWVADKNRLLHRHRLEMTKGGSHDDPVPAQLVHRIAKS